MSFKRYLLVVLLLLVVMPAAAQDEPLIEPAQCAEPGEIDLWVWDENWASVLEESTANWVEKYCPGATVNITQQPWAQYWDVLRTNASSGDLPDIFNMSQVYFYNYAVNDQLLNLQPYLEEAGVDTSVWGSGLVDPYRWGENNDLYGVPVEWVTTAILYNKDLFDAAGVEYPTPDWTWDEFAEKAAALTNPEADVYGAAVYAEYQAGYANWIASTGVEPVVSSGRAACTLTEPDSLRALNFLADLYQQGYMPSVSIIGGASPDDAFNFFAAGKVAMITAGAWKLPEAIEKLEFNWGIAPLPKDPESGRSRSMVHAVGYVASANTDTPELTANLLQYLASDEGQGYFARAGGVAPGNPAPSLQQTWVESFGETDVDIQPYIDATEDSQGITVFEEIWNLVNTELVVNIFDLNMPVEEAAQQACDAISEYVGTES